APSAGGALAPRVGGWAYANEDCRDVWKVPAAPTAMRQPVASSIPTFLISDSFDTLTSLDGRRPPQQACPTQPSPASRSRSSTLRTPPTHPASGALKPPSFSSLASHEPLRHTERAEGGSPER